MLFVRGLFEHTDAVVGWRAGSDYEELAGHLDLDDPDAQLLVAFN
jgi:hypothetical protein